MSTKSICGFVVLRKPEMNFDEKGRRLLRSSAPHIDNIYYGGIDRMEWFDVEDDYYENTLPADICKLHKELEALNADRSDYLLCSDIEKARILLDYSNRNRPANELIAIYSKKLAPVKGTFDSPADLSWLGIDLHYSGFGSQLLEGIFTAPQVFSNFHYLLNQNGLFDTEGPDVDRYIQAYNDRTKDANLEPLGDVTKYLDIIHLARVNI